MRVSIDSNVAELIRSFADAAPGELAECFQQLVRALWQDGELTELANPATPLLVEQFGELDEMRKGYLAVLLGLLVEAAEPESEGKATAAVRQGLDEYLANWSAAPKGGPLSLALQYLLAHFPGDRDQILGVAADLDLDLDDLSRLDRALQRLDPERPVLGRVFPSPSVWALDDSERQFDQTWIKALSPEQIVGAWNADTRTVLGHAGAKAYWSVLNGTPKPWASDSVPPRHSRPDGADVGLFTRHGEAFRCPECGGAFEFEQDSARCVSCPVAYPIAGGILNLTAGIRDGEDGKVSDFQFMLAEMPSMGFFYEAYARPNFLRLSGSNWDAAVTPAQEDDYIAANVNPVDGPVLDLAAGAGRWTEVLAGTVGAERVIALDLNLPMLTTLRARLGNVPAVMASATTLPFHDRSLGAVLCWNALQAFPQDAAAAIAEVGRCLRPGGTFTLLTFRNSHDPIYRYFVASHTFPQHSGGLRLFELDDLKGWLTAAGLRIRAESGPGTFVFITAEQPL